MIKQCHTLDEVRAEIDRTDDEIVRLIAERGRYVSQAASFKKDTAGVKAPARVEAVIAKAKAKAALLGADENVGEAVYRAMIDAFIKAEMNEFERKQVGSHG